MYLSSLFLADYAGQIMPNGDIRVIKSRDSQVMQKGQILKKVSFEHACGKDRAMVENEGYLYLIPKAAMETSGKRFVDTIKDRFLGGMIRVCYSDGESSTGRLHEVGSDYLIMGDNCVINTRWVELVQGCYKDLERSGFKDEKIKEQCDKCENRFTCWTNKEGNK